MTHWDFVDSLKMSCPVILETARMLSEGTIRGKTRAQVGRLSGLGAMS